MNRLNTGEKRSRVMARRVKELSYEDCWPSVFYGPKGQSQVFSSPLEVPDGWHDSPAKVGDAKAKTEIPFYDEAVAAANSTPANEGDGDEEQQDEEGEEGQDELEPEGDDEQPGEGEGEQQEEVQVEALPALEDITKDEIAARLRAKGANFNPTWSKERLYGVLKDALED